MRKVIGQKSVDIEAEVSPCPCCGSEDIIVDSHYSGNGADRFDGYGYVYCKNCKHETKCESNSIGWDGSSLESLTRDAISNWNSQYRCYHKDESTKEKELKQRIKELEEMVELTRSYIATQIPHSAYYNGVVTDEDMRKFLMTRRSVEIR